MCQHYVMTFYFLEGIAMRVMLPGLLVVASCGSITPSAFAQVDPVCREVAADPDGDGFGWQDNASCIITMESEPAPTIINRETNELVNLTRAYWNPPVDLYNKTVFCVNNIYSSRAGAYVADNDPSRETHYTFHYTHFPLTTEAPFTGIVQSEHFVTAGPVSELYYEESFTSWSMDNGIYTGGAPFTQSPYVEIVTEPSTNEKAIRTWSGDGSFVRCSATPTGVPPVFGIESTPEGETTSDQSVQDQTTPEQAPVEQVEDAPDEVIDNPDTGVESDPPSSANHSNETSSTAANNTIEPGRITDSSEAVQGNDATTTMSEISNPFATTDGGGSIGLWYLLLLTGIKIMEKLAGLTGKRRAEFFNY